MSIGDGSGRALSINELPEFTDEYIGLFTSLAKQHDVHIIGGTHIIRRGDRLLNNAYLFYPDGTWDEQNKLHITPTEVKEWNMEKGDGLKVFQTSKGKNRHSHLL